MSTIRFDEVVFLSVDRPKFEPSLMQSITGSNTTTGGIARWTPTLVGLIAFLFVAWMWGSLAHPPVNHDEAAYVLQAKIFASGHLVAPARPLPRFFEQYHTFVEPVVAAKYPPGFSLLLVPGIWIGLAGLIPAVMAALSSVLLFVMARRFAGAIVAFFSVVLANTSDIALHFNPSYASEVATALLFLAGWWALLRHWDKGERRWLWLLALIVGWGAITRPLTMLVYAIPTGIVALYSIGRRRQWQSIAECVAIVTAVIAFMLFWDFRVTGSWRISPHAEYARQYIPADRMGFGLTNSVPERALLPDQQAFKQWVDSLHRGHTVQNLPSIAAARTAGFVIQTWPRGVAGGVLALIGFLFVPVIFGRMIWLTTFLLLGAHLFYAHALDWPAYYLELQGPLSFMAAAGAFGIATAVTRRIAQAKREHQWNRFSRLLLGAFASAPFVFSLIALWLLTPMPADVLDHRRALRAGGAYVEGFQSLLTGLPQQTAIVFVRYASGHSFHQSLVQNDPDSAARLWIVHDLGDDNRRLLSIAPDRLAFLYSETRSGNRIVGALSPMQNPAVVP
jgi:hypothetical protein